MLNDFHSKVNRIKGMLRQKRLDGIWITQQKNFSWLTSGRSFVNISVERASAGILITSNQSLLIVNNIESDRLLEEELAAEFDKVAVFPWYDPGQSDEIVQEYAGNGQLATDHELEREMTALRTVLTDDELRRVMQLGIMTAHAIEGTAKNISQGDCEFKIASLLSARCLKMGIEPIVNLVAADERAFTRRHPLPTSRRLDNYAILVVCGRSKGQVVSASRLVHFGQPPADLVRRHRAACAVDSVLIRHTVSGQSFAKLFEAMKEAYSNVGYPSEWQKHHQGGLAGYASRELLLLPGSPHIIQDRQMYAWNPSISGVKSEDTIVVNGTGKPVILTYSGDFPMFEVGSGEHAMERPDILIRKR